MTDQPELQPDFLSTINAAQLIDPEDARINIAINNRGYFVRCAVSRAIKLLKPDWLKLFEERTTDVLLISFDQKIKSDKTIVDYGTTVYDMGESVCVMFQSSSDQVFFHFWSKDIKIVRAHCQWITENLFEDKVKDVLDRETNTRELTFWGQAGGSYESYNRKVILRTWEDSKPNYPAKISRDLESLIGLKPPLQGGKIILMHGPPGTGKTTLLQILAREWSDWCHTSVITDAENFLGQTGSMLEVLTFNFESYIASNVEKEHAYHLVVIEDADELISSDAKRVSGQALSRLLNIGDGLLGQSTKLLICITTNVDIRNLHAAMIRPGRCLAKLEFTRFNNAEARAWLESHNPTIDAGAVLNNIILTRDQSDSSATGFTLAELYEGLAEHKQISHQKESVTVGQYL